MPLQIHYMCLVYNNYTIKRKLKPRVFVATIKQLNELPKTLLSGIV